MTAIDAEALVRLRSLLEVATPGEWGVAIGKNILVGPIGKAVANCNYDNGAVELCNAKLIAAMHNALPALLDIAEAVARAPVGTSCRDRDGAHTGTIIMPDKEGPPEGQRVRIVPCTGGGE